MARITHENAIKNNLQGKPKHFLELTGMDAGYEPVQVTGIESFEGKVYFRVRFEGVQKQEYIPSYIMWRDYREVNKININILCV